MRSATRRAWSMIATWLRSDPGVASSAYLPGNTTPPSSAPSSARRRWRPASRSASGALAQPGTLVGAGGRRPRLEGADSRPIFMPKNYQIKIHGTVSHVAVPPRRMHTGATATMARAKPLSASNSGREVAHEDVDVAQVHLLEFLKRRARRPSARLHRDRSLPHRPHWCSCLSAHVP